MKKLILNFVLLLLAHSLTGQQVKILYSLTYDLPDAKQLKYFTPKAIEQLKQKQYYYLLKDNTASLFFPNKKPKEFIDKDTTLVSEHKRKIRSVVIKNDLVDIYYINYPKNFYIRKVKTRGKTYDIKNSLPELQWTILADTKKMKDYTLQKAQTTYGNTKITAWFTEDIPVNIGPRIFRGLPGLIMELKMNKLNYKVEKIDFVNNLSPIVPPKPDGKYLSQKKFREIIKKMPRGFKKVEKKCSTCP